MEIGAMFRTVRKGVIVVTVAAIAAFTTAAVASAAAPPSATTTNLNSYSCGDDYCFANTNSRLDAPLFLPNGTLYAILLPGTRVEVTCWYAGSSSGWLSDGYEDHVVWVSPLGNFTGHIPDYYVDFNGQYPWQVGLDKCGTAT